MKELKNNNDLALFASDCSFLRVVLAHLADEFDVLGLKVLVDDVLHSPVLGQIVCAALVKEHRLVTDRTRETESRAGGRESPVSWCADVASGSRTGGRAATNDPGVGFRQDRQLVCFLVRAWRCGLCAGFGRTVGRSLGLLVYRAVQTERVPAWQQNRLHKQFFANRTPQLVLHF